MSNTAWACAVCGSQDEKSAGAYLAMTIFLSLLPLSLIGGVGYMIWKGAKQAALLEQVDDTPVWKDLVLNPQVSEDSHMFSKNSPSLHS